MADTKSEIEQVLEAAYKLQLSIFHRDGLQQLCRWYRRSERRSKSEPSERRLLIERLISEIDNFVSDDPPVWTQTWTRGSGLTWEYRESTSPTPTKPRFKVTFTIESKDEAALEADILHYLEDDGADIDEVLREDSLSSVR